MLPFEGDVINVIDDAFKAGFNIPKYYFEKDFNDSIDGEVYFCDPMYMLKPQGIEFSYVLFWTGSRFKGGFVSMNNNYIGLQRGARSRNGSTLFAQHVPELKRCYRRYCGSEPAWIVHSFVLGDNGKIYYWGLDDIDVYVEQIEKITDMPFDDLVSLYLSEDNTKKPKGFVSSLAIFTRDGEMFTCCGDVADTITKSWNVLYEKADCLKKDLWWVPNIESYMRTAYAKLNVMEKLK